MNDSDPFAPNNQLRRGNNLLARIHKLRQVAAAEFCGFSCKLMLVNALMVPMPMYAGGRIRSFLLRMVGVRIGHGTMFHGRPRISGDRRLFERLVIGRHCGINVGCFFDLGDMITIGDHVSLGHEVFLLTTSHEMGPAQSRCGELTTMPIKIDDGVWIGSRSTILSGISIGAGSVISAGTVVTKDVPPNTIVSSNQRVSISRWG